MRAQRIKTGFHRVGVAVATLTMGVGLLLLWGNASGLSGPTEAISTVAFIAVGALVGYGLMWGLGWVIAGFAGDGEISN